MKKRIILSTVDQGILSALNFFVNMFLIKTWSIENYGMYTIVFSIGLLLIGLQNALINTPYSISWAKGTAGTVRFELVNLLFCIIFPLLVMGVFYLYAEYNGFKLESISVFLYLVGMLFKEYLRAKWIVEQKIKLALVSDVLYIALIALFYAMFEISNLAINFDLDVLLIIIAISSLLSIVVAIKNEVLSVLLPPYKGLFGYSQVWQQSKWSLVGVLSTELQNRGYIYIISTFFGLGTLGIIQAGKVFFGPLNLLISGWGRVVRPVLAKFYHNHEYDKFKKTLNTSYLSFAVINISFCLIIMTFWGSIDSYLYENRYENIAIIVLQWGAVNLFAQMRGIFGIGLQATNRFDLLARATIVGSIVSFAVLFVVVFFELPIYAITSVILSEIVALSIILHYLNKRSFNGGATT